VTDPADRDGSDPLLGEIGRQGDAIRGAASALRAQADALDAVARKRSDGRIVLTGMGSSLAAGHALVATLGQVGIPVDLVNAAELLHFALPTLDGRTTLIVVSQSGRSVEVVRILERLGQPGERPFVIGVSNGTDNPLAKAADVVLDIAVGAELGPATMTYAATLITLDGVGRVLASGGGAEIRGIVDAVVLDADGAALAIGRLLAERAAVTDMMRAWHSGRPTVVIVGRGVGRAATDMASLTLKEVAGTAAESMITADFRHGPLELVSDDLAVAFVSIEPAADAIDRAFAAELSNGPASVLVVGADADNAGTAPAIALGRVGRALAPAVAVVPFQLLARELAIAQGRQPGTFRYASKVTTTE
jgi:glutamine---fructose-6-phosphate transaminase (isomerizing)